MIDSKDREAYEKGLKDRGKSGLEQTVTDLGDIVRDNVGAGRSRSEDAAYYKGRRGEQLDKKG